MTAGFYSPLPPARTGVADYAAALLPALKRLGRVDISPKKCDVSLYHLGNNRLHAAIYDRALEKPGVIVLHDAVLHHLLLGQLNSATYVNEFVYNYGEWHRGLAEELWAGRGGSGGDQRYFQFPLLKRVLMQSRAAIVHNPAAARTVKEHAPDLRVVEIPHLFQPPILPSEGAVARYRGRLGLAPDTFAFGLFGYLRESKRVMAVLEAFTEIRRENSRAALVIAGNPVSSDLERLLEPLTTTGVIRRGYLPDREFWMAACAVDACINLRYPAAGETSGIAIRLMGIGKPVLLSTGEEYGRVPEDACVRIAHGVEEREALYHYMILLTSIPEAGRAIGERGAGHIRTHHQIEQVAQQYWDTLCEFCS